MIAKVTVFSETGRPVCTSDRVWNLSSCIVYTDIIIRLFSVILEER